MLYVQMVLILITEEGYSPFQGVQRRVVLVVIFFDFLKLLCLALLLLYLT